MILKKLHARISVYVQWLEQFADRSWYPPLLSILAALDSMIVVIPNDGILVASSMLQPKRWSIFAVFVSIGSTIGAVILAVIVAHQGLPWVLEMYPWLAKTEVWTWSVKFFDEYGLYLVFAVSALPISQQPVIILAGIAHTPFLKLASVLFAGRIIKFLAMAFIASHSPKLLNKIWGLKDDLQDAGVKIDEKEN